MQLMEAERRREKRQLQQDSEADRRLMADRLEEQRKSFVQTFSRMEEQTHFLLEENQKIGEPTSVFATVGSFLPFLQFQVPG